MPLGPGAELLLDERHVLFDSLDDEAIAELIRQPSTARPTGRSPSPLPALHFLSISSKEPAWGIALLVVLVVVGLWAISAYNRLISLKNQVANAWKQIDVQLKRRHDLIPNLVNAVKGAMDFEKSTLEAVISARNKAVSASGVPQVAKAEGELTQALGRLFALSENYPQLKATANIQQLQEELTSTENKVGFARQLYNDVATSYNTAQQQFPTNLMAGVAKAAPAELWAIEDAAERAVPNVDLKMN